MTLDVLHQHAFSFWGATVGTERWVVRWKDDPADGAAPADPDTNDLRIATVTIVYRQESAEDSVHFMRLLPAL